MTTQEAIEKLKNYDELEGKYNDALARIDEYERERKKIGDKALKALAEREQNGADHIALTEITNMLAANPAFSDDDLEVGDEIFYIYYGCVRKAIVINKKRNRIGEEIIEIFTECFYGHQNFINRDSGVRKTGKHYPQMAEILAAVKGEGENDEIAD